MSFKLRQSPFVLYRLVFVLLIYATGIASTCVWILESYTNIQIITLAPGTTFDAILATLAVTGLSGMVAGSIMLALMTDRRTFVSERRQRQVEIDFTDRREGDRRETQ